jgi:uncharacterized protein (DUF1501 family)
MSTRRHLLQAALAGVALAPWARLSVAAPAAESGSGNNFVMLILRGGMDGLWAVPAIGDPSFADARGALARYASPPMPLDDIHALHPLLPGLHASWGRGELAVVHAVGLPYRERSHFDAQQVLESGGQRPHELTTGWLGRALQASHGASSASNASSARGGLKAVALQTAPPLILRGGAAVDSWAPSVLPEPTPDLVARLETLYRNDPALAQALARARGLRDDPGMADNPPGMAGGGRNGQALALARKAAEFLQRGTPVAVMELGGWDSHANQAAPGGALSNNLRTLDAVLQALREGLLPGGAWDRTVVLVATEFGREVAPNGTQGSDHGTGGAALLLGGAVQGGRVISDWPGLARKDRFEGRDLRITTDLRAVLRPILADHLGVPRAALDATVLPGSAAVKSLDLLRG